MGRGRFSDTQPIDLALVLTALEVEKRLRQQADPEKASFFPRFFKTGPGEYGEGDQFLGLTVPSQRSVAKEFKDLPLGSISELLGSPYHECRFTALVILTERYRRARSDQDHGALCGFYLEHLASVNNWDLVDATAHKILGAECVRTGQFEILDRLAGSGDLWSERVAVIATLALIKAGVLEPTLRLCFGFLSHHHDLIHKATGWMLRELGKVNESTLDDFLERHAHQMPRTMLRYAIEKKSEAERGLWLSRKA